MDSRIRQFYIVSIIVFFLVNVLDGNAQAPSEVLKVSSADKQTELEIKTDANGQLLYRILFQGKEEIKWSGLGMVLNNGDRPGQNTRIISTKKDTRNETFDWPLGENDKIGNNYNEFIINCTSGKTTFDIVTRVFNGSVAFRYILKNRREELSQILEECTTFNLARPYTIYQYHQETEFTPTPVNELKKASDFPATLVSEGLNICINEADNRNYTKAMLKNEKSGNNLSVTFMKDTVKTSGNYSTPWRTVSFAEDIIGLHEYSDLVLKLCPPAQNGIPSWVKPGKLIRAKNTTQSGIDCVDFAVKHHYQYVLFDGSWYGGIEGRVNPIRPNPKLDLQKVIDYGKKHDIGIILYINHDGLFDEKLDFSKLDVLLPLYKKWGVAGVKFGFVRGLSQRGINWVTEAVKRVTDYGFIVNIHDNYKPTGLSRTYPAIITQEGIRGNERKPDAFHNTVLPFTRFLSGAADYTFCFPPAEGNNKEFIEGRLQVTKAHQLALPVIYFSPLQSMLWYGSPTDYTNEQEIEFYDYVPTVWNESRYLKGRIGEFVSVARRTGTTWFVGSIAGLKEMNESIVLDFLDEGKIYRAIIYEDDSTGSIRKRSITVGKNDHLDMKLNATGGQAVMISLAK